ncbi:Cytochrome P450 [Penicillium soppii]|uniref:Cytochrome P450 n=1 Tax=Penicillium soppii TaxID=69789 RepID=UPI002548ACB5|nr:Cytochrome P450 [Penicillium soppii]KAJ5851425.1 Cytochrome P450 [Penicillium soppii]
MTILLLIFLIFLPPTLFLTWYLHVPRTFPPLPKIPIYVSILGLWSSMGQDEIYDRWFRMPLETHGAVIVWFGGRWSILVSRPDLLTDLFRNENLYAKAGSQIKIPHAVIATLVGDNIINSHENWKLFTSIMKPGLQKKVFDTTSLLRQSRKLVDVLISSQSISVGESILVNDDVQKWAVDVMGENFLDLDFESLGHPNNHVRLESLQSIIKATLFKPMYFSFPDLDRFTWLLPSRKRAYEIMHEFDNRLFAKTMQMINQRANSNEKSEEMVSHMLAEAFLSKQITEKQFRDNLKITFLTAHENAQQLVNSMFWQLGTRLDIQSRLRAEIIATSLVHPDPSQDIINTLPYLTSVVLELLRLFPPVSQLINRVATEPALLGGTLLIPKGTFVGWNAWAVHSNTAVWGADAREFRPERVSWVVDSGYRLKMTPVGLSLRSEDWYRADEKRVEYWLPWVVELS